MGIRPWSREEDRKLRANYPKRGSSWDGWKRLLPDRTEASIRNRAHCEYLIALGSYGLGDRERAKKCYDAVLAIDKSHQGAILHKNLLK